MADDDVPIWLSKEIEKISEKCFELLEDYNVNGIDKFTKDVRVLHELCNNMCSVIQQRSLSVEWNLFDEMVLEGTPIEDLKVHYELHRDILNFHTKIDAANEKFVSKFEEHCFKHKRWLHPRDIPVIISFYSHIQDTIETVKALEIRLLNLKLLLLL